MRTIQAPGIEVHEIDRSGYDSEENNSIVGTTVFLMGFANKGQDYATKYINSFNSFINTYGYPTNEAERYFYNAAYEVFNRGGNLYATKLPYDNESLKKFSYCSYTVGTELCSLMSPYDIVQEVSSEIYPNLPLYDFLMMVNTTLEKSINVLLEDKTTLDNEDDLSGNIKKEQGDSLNIAEYLTENNIYLPIIDTFFEYILEKTNFKYTTQDFFAKIFFNSDINHYRNDAVKTLSEVYKETNEWEKIKQEYFPEETKEELEKYKELYEDMVQSLKEVYDTFEEWLEKFGKTLSLSEYCAFYDQYWQDVTNIQSVDTKQQTLLSILSSYEPEKGDVDNKTYTELNPSPQKKLLRYSKHTQIKQVDDSISSYIEIKSNEQQSVYSGMITMDNLDKFRTEQSKVPNNQIFIVDLTRQKYQSDDSDYIKKEYVGILPVITTAANALYYQKLIENDIETESEYNPVGYIQNKYSNESSLLVTGYNNDSIKTDKIAGFTQNIGPEQSTTEDMVTLSETAASYFPEITFKNERISIEHLKKIGVVVFKMFVDDSNNGKIGFTPVESFVGSLNRSAVDVNSGATTFIDRIVNTNSNYINFFSNVKFSSDSTTQKYNTDKCATLLIQDQTATSLGFYEKECDKDISIKESINNAIEMIFENNKDPNTTAIDIVLDAGVSNIAQFIKSVYASEKGKFDFSSEYAYLFKLESSKQAQTWINIINKYDNFCKNVRTDCMFIADGPRPLCLIGEEKLIRTTKPENTIENQIIPRLKYVSNVINSSYGAGYCNWFKVIDQFSGTYFWCPPSIKATGVYIYTDAYSHTWMAPAGQRRGKMLSDVVDVAFNPTNYEAGKIYINNWNYAISYPLNGIVLEGQKTYQRDKTAFDRVNVRRLFLQLEKSVRYLSKFFTYEGITDQLMQRYVDVMTPIFEDAKTNGGISDYAIICDSRNNNSTTIDNNELHCSIAIRPIKSLEFILINFIASSQGASVAEVASENL